MPRRALIIGGSLAGLLSANLFHRRGWEVRVFERAAGDLEGRGAGITILPGLVSGFESAGSNETEQSLGLLLRERIALDGTGRIVAQLDFEQAMTSWGRLYQTLRTILPEGIYRGGHTLVRVEQTASAVTAMFSEGHSESGDLLIAADGLRSTVRSQFLPDLQPHYAGYIAWRCLADESVLDPARFARLMNCYSVCVAPGEQGIAYPVPGPDHSREPGRRQYNVVWYHPVREHDELPLFLTDDRGRYHSAGISPAALSTRVRDEMVATAQGVLPPVLAEAIRKARVHFLQAVMDIEPTRLVFGRVALIGDAAFAARPHVAMGVPKGSGDALALVNALDAGVEIPTALADYEKQRLRVGSNIVARGRLLGQYMEAQIGTDAMRRDAERRRDPAEVLARTAAPFNYA